MNINEILPEQEKQAFIEFYQFKIKELENKIESYKALISKISATNSNNYNTGIDTNSLVEENTQVYDVSKELEEYTKTINPIDNKISLEIDVDLEKKKKVPRQNWKYLCVTGLTKLDGFSTSNELYDFIIQEKIELRDYEKTDIVSKISTALSNLHTKDKVQKIKNSMGRGYFWGLSAWFEDGKISPMYKELLLDKYGVDEASLFGDY